MIGTFLKSFDMEKLFTFCDFAFIRTVGPRGAPPSCRVPPVFGLIWFDPV
jgi:hypothetical protein